MKNPIRRAPSVDNLSQTDLQSRAVKANEIRRIYDGIRILCPLIRLSNIGNAAYLYMNDFECGI